MNALTTLASLAEISRGTNGFVIGYVRCFSSITLALVWMDCFLNSAFKITDYK